MDGHGIDAMAALWDEGQRAFWSAACGIQAGEAVKAAVPDPGAFDGFWTGLGCGLPPAGRGETWAALAKAAAAYRGVILGAWQRVRAEFEIQRLAMIDPAGPPPDWRLVRERWFDIAEAEFIRTQRSEAFLSAQRDVLRAVLRWRGELSDDERALIDATHGASRAGGRLARVLGLEGIRIAATPKETVWQEGRATLARYLPLGRQNGVGPALGPVLICHGLIGRQTMTDLTPERSLVRNLLATGVDVFALDWGDAGAEDAENGFAHYADALLGRVLGAVRAASGAPRPVLFGICQGGTFAACHAARHRDLAGLILGVTPIDFHADDEDADPAHGLLNVWVRSLDEPDLEDLIGALGGIPGELMGVVFNQLNPVRTIAKYAVDLPEAARDPRTLATFLAMEKWLADRPDMPAALAREWLVECYHRNSLATGRFGMGGAPVDLGRIAVPVLNVFATGDHIIPPPCSRALGRLMDRQLYEDLALPTGHVGVFVSARSQALLAPAIISWLRRLA